jgi:uncharacterized protein (DUF2384 family)
LTEQNPIRRKMFVKSGTIPKLSPESMKRQGLITHLAYSLLGDSAEAIQFLNQSNPTLGGRPLAVATASGPGYLLVADAIRLLAKPHVGRIQ